MITTIKEWKEQTLATNSLGVRITRPYQILIIMRGIPGSGKSTKAKTLKRHGSIHSTDDLIEAQGDYNQFFKDMIEKNDFSPLSRMHKLNEEKAAESMMDGISPVIIDNTNIRASDAKYYVEKALKLGYEDKNIRFQDIGTGGLSAEQLAERNTHNVPLNIIEDMIKTYQETGPLTVDKVMQSQPVDYKAFSK